MSDEPIAKRTRLSVLNSKLERLRSARELQKRVNDNNKKIMAAYNEIIESTSSMREIEKAIREHAMGCECKCQCTCKRELIKMEHKFKDSYDRLKLIRLTLFHSQQISASIFVEKLHPRNCKQSDDCLSRMLRVLIQDPLSLERKGEQYPFPNLSGQMYCEYRHSPLHDAVRKHHVKCVKFLLERGASVTSLATCEEDTLLHTLYLYAASADRLVILKLLLKYGISRIFQHNQAGEYALKQATRDFRVDEVSLLLQHGATMSQEELQIAFTNSWKMYELPVIKQYFLHYSKRFSLGPGAISICLLLVQHCYKQMVLPGVPLDECHAKLLEALQFYKVLGGRFHAYTKSGSTTNLMQYLKCYRHKRHFLGVRKRIIALVSNPLSLKEIPCSQIYPH